MLVKAIEKLQLHYLHSVLFKAWYQKICRVWPSLTELLLENNNENKLFIIEYKLYFLS